MTNKHLGSALSDLLGEEGILEEVTLAAKKRAMALQLEEALRAKRLKKSELANRMGTSRAQLDRVLDPDNESVTLKTLFRVGAELGLELQIAYVPCRTHRARTRRVKRK
jgi:antitoxin HicB